MNGEPPRAGDRPGSPDGKPSRMFFDDLPGEPDGARQDPDRPRPLATTPAASARRRQDIEDSLADTGPMEPIREPIPDEQATGKQLYFDDVAATEVSEPEPVQDAPLERRPIIAGRTTLIDARRGRTLPIGAVLAVLGVLVLVAVIASLGGRGDNSSKNVADRQAQRTGVTEHHSAPAPRRTAAQHSAAAPPARTAHRPTPSTHASSPAAPTHTPAAPTHSPAGTPLAAALAQPITVLNNTTISGLAQQAASTFTQHGWRVGGVGNYTGQIGATTVYYDPGSALQQQAATTLSSQFHGLIHTAPRFAGLPGAGLTVVLAPDWTA